MFNVGMSAFENGGYHPHIMMLADIDGDGQTELIIVGSIVYSPLLVFRLVDGIPTVQFAITSPA